MPIIVFPFGLNVLMLLMIWMSQLSFFVKMLITASIVVKFSLYLYSVIGSDSEWLEITNFIVIPLFNVAIIVLGIVYNIMTMVLPAATLVVVFLIWKILPCTVVIQEKEGSRE